MNLTPQQVEGKLVKARLDRHARREKARHQLARDGLAKRCPSVWRYAWGDARCEGGLDCKGPHHNGGALWFTSNVGIT